MFFSYGHGNPGMWVVFNILSYDIEDGCVNQHKFLISVFN